LGNRSGFFTLKMDDQLQQLIELQKEQNQLLKRHLSRLRFSLATLLLLTTVSCLALGYVSYQIRGATPPANNAAPVAPGNFFRISIPPMPSQPQPIDGGPQPPVYTPPDRYGGLLVTSFTKHT
jgi:hypothetical protein